MKKIVIDLMGSDLGKEEILAGAFEAVEALPDYGFVLVGDFTENDKNNEVLHRYFERIELIQADSIFLNTDSPMEIPKGRDDTSLVKSLVKLASDDDCVALLSCGSTGGLLVGSIFRLGLVKGLKMPALASHALSKSMQRFVIVDCGANLDVDEKSLLKFGRLGIALEKSFAGKGNPRVGLLNVGKEKGKGNALLKAVYPLFENSGMNFAGNIEGDHVFNDEADVIICDGFAGNVLIKSADHVSKVVLDMVMNELPKSEANEAIYKKIRARFNYNEEGAAIVLGSRKICLKGHGSASRKTILSSCLQADILYRGGFIEAVASALGE